MAVLAFKGVKDGIKVTFGDLLPTVDQVVAELEVAGNLLTLPLFFDFGALPITRRWMADLYGRLITELNVTVTGFTAESEEGGLVLAGMGFNDAPQTRRSTVENSTAILSKALRTGQLLEHDGDVVLVGDLHTGAEICATGNVIVLGQLKGLVHAGCAGDDSKYVISLRYLANQIRIGGKVSVIREPAECPWWGKGVNVHLKNGVFAASELKLEKGVENARL